MLTFTGRALVALGLLIILILASPPQAVYACSGEPPDPKEAAAIAEGWVERVTLRPDLPSISDFIPVEVTLRVERFLHGSAPNPLTFVDPRSAVQRPGGSIIWAGASGACGILDADPTGQYALIVFGRGRDGELTVHRIAGAAFDRGPDAPRIERFRQYLTARLLPAPPNAGAGQGAGTSVQAPLPLRLGLGLLLLTILGGTVALRRVLPHHTANRGRMRG